jgi:hypothetical protein
VGFTTIDLQTACPEIVPHHLRHVLRIIFIQMSHVALQFAHGAKHPRIIQVGHSSASVRRLSDRGGGFLRTAGCGETAHLLDHLFIAALWAGRHPLGLDALGQKVEDHPALRTGKFVDRHRQSLFQAMKLQEPGGRRQRSSLPEGFLPAKAPLCASNIRPRQQKAPA